MLKIESFSFSDVIKILTNLGIDIECGACMEIAFTGITTNEHTCKAGLAKQVNASDLKSDDESLSGSIPESGTKL